MSPLFCRTATAWAAASLALLSCTRDLALPANTGDSLSGRVIAEAPGTGETVAAPGAHVEIAGTGVAVVADAQGQFTIPNPPPPPRALLVSWSSTGAGGTVDRQRLFRSQALDGRGAIQLGDLLVAANAEVRGRILLSDKDRNALDLIGTVVFVPRYPYTGVTGQGGAFLLAHLPPGAVSLGVFRPGYAVASVEAIDLQPGSAVELREISLVPLPAGAGPPGALSGVVKRPDGTAAAGATVTVVSSAGGTPRMATAGADGAYAFTSLPPGPYTVTATDAATMTSAVVGNVLVVGGATASDAGTVTLSAAPATTVTPSGAPPPPVAHAGGDLFVAPGAAIALDGSASDGQRLVFHWSSDLAGAQFSVNDSVLAEHTTLLSPATPGSLHVTLVVEDGFGQRSGPDTKLVVVDVPPVATLVVPAAAPTGAALTLDASTSTAPAGTTLTYAFSLLAAPASSQAKLAAGASLAQAKVTPDVEGTYRFSVSVSDGRLASTAAASVLVANVNHPPVALVAAPPPAQAGDDVVLDGSGSTDVDPGDAAALTFAWTPLNGAPATTSGAKAALAHVTAPALPGSYPYQLVVTDPHGASSAPAVALVVVNPAPPPPPAKVLATFPASGATSVPTTTAIEIDFDAALDATAAVAATLGVTAGSATLPGTLAYSDAGGRHSLTFSPSTPLPTFTTVTVALPALKDAAEQATAPLTFSFKTDVPNWQDISPVDPARTAGSPVTPVHFSSMGVAPAISTGPTGTWLLDWEIGNGATNAPYGAVMYAWTPTTGAWAYSTPLNLVIESYNGCCLDNRALGAQATNAPFRRTFLGLGGTGATLYANESGDAGLQIGSTATPSNTLRSNYVRPFVGLGGDGTQDWVAFRGCDVAPGSAPAGGWARAELWLAPANQGSLPSVTSGVIATTDLFPHTLTSCTSPITDAATDIGLSPPALASGPGLLYLALSWQPTASAKPAMALYARPAGATGTLGPPLTDAAHPAGALNVLPVNGKSQAALATSVGGPILVFTEGTAAPSLRATRWDEATSTFVDPLTGTATNAAGGATGSSIVALAPADAPAVVAVGAVTYVAYRTVAAGGHRLFVAHSDALQKRWIVDASKANVDGALNVNAGCDVSPPSLSLVDGYPAVAWGELCAVGGGVTENFVVVKRLR